MTELGLNSGIDLNGNGGDNGIYQRNGQDIKQARKK